MYRLIHSRWLPDGTELLTLTDLEGNVIEADMTYDEAVPYFQEEEVS